MTLPNQRQVTSFPLPSYVHRDVVVCSKTFQILYRNEEVCQHFYKLCIFHAKYGLKEEGVGIVDVKHPYKSISLVVAKYFLYLFGQILLSDVALFRAHVLVDSDRLDASLSRAGFFLCVDLWFCEHEHLLPSINKVSSAHFNLPTFQL